jgi:hypothetical protein
VSQVCDAFEWTSRLAQANTSEVQQCVSICGRSNVCRRAAMHQRCGIRARGEGFDTNLLEQDSKCVVREHVADQQHAQQVVAVLSPRVNGPGPLLLDRRSRLTHLSSSRASSGCARVRQSAHSASHCPPNRRAPLSVHGHHRDQNMCIQEVGCQVGFTAGGVRVRVV